MSHWSQYIVLALLWCMYFILHSMLIIPHIKARVITIAHLNERKYRLLYSLFSIIALLSILLYNGIVQGPQLFPKFPVLRTVGLFISVGGVILVREAFKQYSFKKFIGIKNPEEYHLSREGILNKIRHPIYAAIILISLGFICFDSRLPTLLSVLCILAYLPVGIYLEEKKLIARFGDDYLRYKNEVPSILPRFYWPFL